MKSVPVSMIVSSARIFLHPAVSLIAVLLLAAQAPVARGQTLEVLHYFQGIGDGFAPTGGLVEGADGNFYGTAADAGNYNHGTVFQITPARALTVLHSFDGINGYEQPATTLALGTNGSFYGTADFELFCVTAGGGFIDLGSGAGGASGSGLMRGRDGNFYGANATRVYQLAPDGATATLFQFPFSGSLHFYTRLTEGNDGNLYGVDQTGGANNQGMVYKITRTPGDVSDTMTDLVDFAFSNGANPTAGLVLANDGNFYGTTRNGTNGYPTYGTIFKMSPDGALTTLFTFHGTDGSGPAALVQASDGNFYGTTSAGGANNNGTVFRFTPEGVFTTLASFAGTNGANPQAELIQGDDGHFYGTASQGGILTTNSVNGCGTVFRLVIPPAFEAPTVANGLVTFTWRLVPRQTYQLQYSTNLSSGQWFNQGSPVTATTTTASISQTPGADSQRFYRIQLTK